jgi:predicted nucleic acid-binding protein
MIVLVDTNVVLDVLLEHDPFFAPAVELWEKTETGEQKAFACSLSFNNVYYIARKEKGRETARAAVRLMLDVFAVASVDEAVLRQADARWQTSKTRCRLLRPWHPDVRMW